LWTVFKQTKSVHLHCSGKICQWINHQRMFCIKYSALTELGNGKMYRTVDKFSITRAEPGTNMIWELYFLSEDAQFKLSMYRHKQTN
jgi:hypothetical protein